MRQREIKQQICRKIPMEDFYDVGFVVKFVTCAENEKSVQMELKILHKYSVKQ